MNGYRRVLVHVSDSERSVAVLALATRVAIAQGATLRAVHAVPPLHLGAHLVPESAMIAAQLAQQTERERTARARDRVLQTAEASGIEIEFQSPGGDPLKATMLDAGAADLVVMGQPLDDDPQGPTRRFATQLLMGSGCPVLFVPGIGPVADCGARVLVAWSPRRETARAMRDALPLLKQARTVEVLRFGAAPPSGGPEPLDDVVVYLRAHGVSAGCSVRPVRETALAERLLRPTGVDASIAELLLSHAADTAADLIVMGGYGHTRAHEWVLGGVTRTILGSMTIPVLMAH